MDDNTMKLIERIIDMQEELSELKAMKSNLVKVLWDKELSAAKDAQKHPYPVYTSIQDIDISVSDVREVFGIMPNPEAVSIYKTREELMNGRDEE